MSHRKLGLDRLITELTENGMRGFIRAQSDVDLEPRFRDILLLTRAIMAGELMESFNLSNILCQYPQTVKALVDISIKVVRIHLSLISVTNHATTKIVGLLSILTPE